MKKISNVTALQFSVIFNGNGCVNFDDSDQKYITNKLGFSHVNNDNVMYAKKQFINENGVNKFKYKVSSECLRHAIFERTMPAQNPSIVSIPTILYNAIAMPDFILRGYTFTQRDKNGLKKKSPLTITDAVEVGEGRTDCVFDFHSTSSEKSTSKVENAKSSTSIYNIENVGALQYEAKGFINVSELQFIPDDATYDRLALGGVVRGSAEEKIYLKAISQNMVNMENPEIKYYFSEGAYHKDEWGEKGLLLNEESVDMLIKRLLKQIMDVNIQRRNAYLHTISLTVDVITSDGNRIKIDLMNDNIDDYYFSYALRYKEADDAKIMANAKKFEEYKNEEKSNKKTKKNNTSKQDEE